MYISEMDLMKAKLEAGKRLNDSDIIKTVIGEDGISLKKRKMEEGERYFQCKHDILKKDFRVKGISETVQRSDGTEGEGIHYFTNPNKSNHHVMNPFHYILVAQKAAYLVGREPSITVCGAEEKEDLKGYEKMLTQKADEEFNRIVYEWIIGAANKGVEYLHVYYDAEGVLRFCIVPAEQVIVFYDSVYETEIEQVIRYYDITILVDGKEEVRKKVEWWTKDDVTYFSERADGEFEVEPDRANPCPHWVVTTTMDGLEKTRENHGWGRVPFIPLRNNPREMTDLELIKGLVDAYDLISSEGTNNLLDLVDLYWVIEGYGGEAASAIAKKLQINKAVHISDSSGKVEAKQVELPVDGRLQWMKMIRKDIFHFGMGVDTDSDDLGKAPSGISLKFQYSMFHLKINGIVPEIKGALKQLFRFITEDMNRREGTNFDWRTVEIGMNLNAITDDMETMTIIEKSKGVVSEKTLLGKHPFVDDVNGEMEQIMAERKLEMEKEEEKE